MPKINGKGPGGQGLEKGRGMGRCQSKGRGRMGGNRAGAGPAGECICPNCSTTVQHQAGVPCYQTDCPECGAKMMRQQEG